MTGSSPFQTIRWQFVFAAVVPLVLITTLLTVYLVSARHQDARQQFLESSRVGAAYLGDSAVLELYSGNRERLRDIADSAIRNNRIPGLVGAAFLDSEQQPVALSNGSEVPPQLLNHRPPVLQLQLQDRLYLQVPIALPNLNVDDYNESPSGAASAASQQRAGWVIASFDTTGIRRQQLAIVLTGVGIGLGGLVMAVALSLYLGRIIVHPVQQLTGAVRQMESGDLSARAETSATDELSRLALGINQLAESVAEGRNNLEHKVHMATWRLEDTLEDLRDKNRELEVARESAEAANQAKSDFLARMSHELRTPITAIQGFTRLLQNTELGDAERSYTTIINQSSAQLLNLIDDILAISKLQADAIEIDNSPFNLIETLEQSVNQMALPARDKGLELILDIAPEVPTTVVGDSFRVAQVITNLVSNAVKFTDRGHVRTSVNTRPRNDRVTDIQIRVSDTGIGIPDHKREHLFQAFAQADTSITRRFGGTGLGLAIVKSLVDLMGGTILLENNEQAVTTFLVTLPMPITAIEKGPEALDARIALIDQHPLSRQALADNLCRFVGELEVLGDDLEAPYQQPDALVLSLPSDDTTADHRRCIGWVRDHIEAPLLVLSPSPELALSGCGDNIRFLDKPATLMALHRALGQLINGSPAQSSGSANSRLLAGLRILIAEDNPFTREFLKTLLAREGAYCVTAADGIAAVAACGREPFDIMLIDIHMPGKSGIETVRDIRSSEQANRNAPILTITADVLQQERLALDEAGITDLLFKPVDEAQLLERILRYCRPDTELPQLHQKLGDEIPVDEFLAEVDRLIDAADSACRSGDLEAARDPVHQLLGVAGVFKLPELEVKVSALHKALKSHRHSQALAALDDLIEERARLVTTSS